MIMNLIKYENVLFNDFDLFDSDNFIFFFVQVFYILVEIYWYFCIDYEKEFFVLFIIILCGFFQYYYL